MIVGYPRKGCYVNHEKRGYKAFSVSIVYFRYPLQFIVEVKHGL